MGSWEGQGREVTYVTMSLIGMGKVRPSNVTFILFKENRTKQF